MVAGCEKDEQPLETDPAKIILGRWELSKVWMSDDKGYRTINKDDPYDIVYLEFGPDSSFRYQVDNMFAETSEYWLVDTLLYYDNRISPWVFDFTDDNTLYLYNAFPALRPIGEIYKRRKQ